MRLVFLQQSTSICHSFWKLCWNVWEIIFPENKIKWKRSDGESAKAVREQVFLLWYKPDPNIVESFVSKSAYCQYCRCCPESAAKNWKYSNVSEDTTNLLSLLLSWTCYRWYFSHLMLKMTWNTGHWVCVDQRIALYKNYLLLLLSVFECKNRSVSCTEQACNGC